LCFHRSPDSVWKATHPSANGSSLSRLLMPYPPSKKDVLHVGLDA
jgi:hypothetical protein